MKENAPTEKVADGGDSFDGSTNIRNVCFVLLDGTMQFFNYGYLVSAKYMPDQSIIILFFTSETVTLEGVLLENLFLEFMQHVPKHITCTDVRYNVIKKEKSLVNRIDISPSKE